MWCVFIFYKRRQSIISTETGVTKALFNFQDFEAEEILFEKRESTYSYDTRQAVIVKGKAVYNRSKVVCPKCGGDPDEKGNPRYGVHGHGTRGREVQDIPAQGSSLTFLSYRVPNFRCLNPDCGHTFSPTFSFVDKNGQKTRRFKEFLTDLTFRKFTFSAISEFYDVNADQLEQWFLERVKALDAKRESVHIPHLGIDEKTIDGKSYIVVLDTSKKPADVIDIAPGGKTADGFKKAVLRIKNHKQIQTITIDMCAAYISALNSLYPNRTNPDPETGEIIGPRIIIDRFHVTQYLFDAISATRKALYEARKAQIYSIPDALEREMAKEVWHELNKINHLWFYKDRNDLSLVAKGKLFAFCKQYPEFAQLLAIKEDFKEIFDTAADSEEAENRYAAWVSRLPLDNPAYEEFHGFLRTVNNHYREIFNYFMGPVGERYSNGPVEAKNTVIGEIVQAMRGARFEVIRGKVLYGQTRVADRKKVPAVAPKHLLDGPDSFSMALDTYLSGLHEAEIVEAVSAILERCAAESHMMYNEGCTLEAALQHVRETGFVNSDITKSILVNDNLQARLSSTAEALDIEQMPPVVTEPITQQEFINRWLYYAAEASLADHNDLSSMFSIVLEDDDGEEHDL